MTEAQSLKIEIGKFEKLRRHAPAYLLLLSITGGRSDQPRFQWLQAVPKLGDTSNDLDEFLCGWISRN